MVGYEVHNFTASDAKTHSLDLKSQGSMPEKNPAKILYPEGPGIEKIRSRPSGLKILMRSIVD